MRRVIGSGSLARFHHARFHKNMQLSTVETPFHVSFMVVALVLTWFWNGCRLSSLGSRKQQELLDPEGEAQGGGLSGLRPQPPLQGSSSKIPSSPNEPGRLQNLSGLLPALLLSGDITTATTIQPSFKQTDF